MACKLKYTVLFDTPIDNHRTMLPPISELFFKIRGFKFSFNINSIFVHVSNNTIDMVVLCTTRERLKQFQIRGFLEEGAEFVCTILKD